jgi:hypothetical protein
MRMFIIPNEFDDPSSNNRLLLHLPLMHNLFMEIWNECDSREEIHELCESHFMK